MEQTKNIKVASKEHTVTLRPGDSVMFAFPSIFESSHGFLDTICEFELINDNGVLRCDGPLRVVSTKEAAANGQIIKYKGELVHD